MANGQKKTLADRFVGVITRHPVRALVLGLAGFALLATGLPRIHANFTHTAFFKGSDPMLARFNAFERRFGNDDAVVMVVHSPTGIFDVDSATLLRDLTERMWKLPEVIRVDSLANFQWVHALGDEIEVEPLLPDRAPLTPELLAERRAIALAHETIPDYLVSRDGTTALLYARIKPAFEGAPDAALITKEARRVVKEMKRTDHDLYLTGGPIITASFQEASSGDASRLVPLLLVMVLLFLVASFRRVGGVVIPLVVILLSVMAAMGFAGITGIEMSVVTMTLPQVLIAVCVSDAVHLLATFYRARRRGLSRRQAAYHSLHKNFLATILTSLTTSVGFLSFATAKLPPVLGLGVLAGAGTVFAWFFTYLIMGPLMMFWPGRDAGATVPSSTIDALDDDLGAATARSSRFVAFLARWRWSIIGATTLAVVGSVVLTLSNQVNSDPFKYFRPGSDIRKAQDFVISRLNGVVNFELMVDSGAEDGIKDPAFLRKVETFERRALELPGITKAVSVVDIIRQTNRSLNGGKQEHYRLPADRSTVAQELLLYTMGLPQGMDVNDRITVKNDAIRVTLLGKITESNAAVDTAAKLEQLGREVGLNAQVTGKTMLYQGMNGYVVESFIQSLAIALALIGLIMLVSFGSPKLGLISMIPNVVPLVVGGAVLRIIGQPLDIGTVLVASVCLGIAVDNTIHILSNFTKHTREGDSPQQALARLMAHTGPAMIITTLVLVAGFGTLAFGTFMPNVFFGIMTATILTTGLLTDLFLLPALLLVLPARAARRAGLPVPANPVV